MKVFKTLKAKLLVVLILIICCTTISHAETSIQPRTSKGEPVVTSEDNGINLISENENVGIMDESAYNDDLFLFESTVNIDYPVYGNVFIMAKNVVINNNIEGNLFILAEDLNIGSSAAINSSAFLCAANISIDGFVNNLYSTSDNLTFSSNSIIGQNITSIGNTLNLSGFIGRNAKLYFNNIDVEEDSTYIAGNLDYSAKSSSIKKDIVAGQFNYHEEKVKDVNSIKTLMIKKYVKNLLTSLIISIIAILCFIYAIPKFSEKTYDILKHKPMQTLGYGILLLFGIPIVCIILCFTIIGIVPAIIILLLYILLIKISAAIISIPLAKIICNKMNKNSNGMVILISIIIVLAIWLLEKLSFIGGIISLAVTLYGFGIIAYSIFGSKSSKKDKNIVAEASVVIESKENSHGNNDSVDIKNDSDSKVDKDNNKESEDK